MGSDESNRRIQLAIAANALRYGPDGILVLELKAMLGHNYRRQRRFREAKELDTVVLAKRRELFGNDHSSIAKSLHNLALDLRGLGETDESLDLQEEAVAILFQADGAEAPSTLTRVNDLASMYADAGYLEDAAELHDKVVDVRTRVLGEAHIDTIMSMTLLGSDYRDMGQRGKALRWQSKAMALARTHLGRLHDTSITCIANMAMTWTRSGRRLEAQAMLEATKRAWLESGQWTTPMPLPLMNGLAVEYYHAGRLKDAKDLIDPSIRVRRAIHAGDALLVQRILKSNPSILHNPDTSLMGLSNSNLHLAASLGHRDICEVLLRAGHEEPCPALNDNHQTALMLAAGAGHTDVVHLLCESDPDSILRRDVRGRDAIMEASMGGHDTILQLLLTYVPGGPFEAVQRADKEGNTALHFASSNGNLLGLRTLLAAGADVERRNIWNWTPAAYSATVQAEVYLKGLVSEVERRHQLKKEAEVSKKAGFVRVVPDDSDDD
ncbi:spherulin-1B precursor [Purpureocillium lilacinum]|uniref:Spherulin-1B n=1 Tax=Purpureocillium lilacinum TaxID=33203 RepID=A0A179HU16_PURLI|nr:spherulin-1B precursor [Purpureocillium lilacinum]OAQ92890.1 spherulin-1B precursor [Purpureocillium lilacinum]